MKKWIWMFLLIGCTSAKDEKILEESREIHSQAIKLGKQVDEKIAQLKEELGSMEDSLKAVAKDSVISLKADLSIWEASIVEVPGDDHDHDHQGHDHDHGHAPSPDLTPEMALEVQKELKARAEALNNRAQSVLDALKKE